MGISENIVMAVVLERVSFLGKEVVQNFENVSTDTWIFKVVPIAHDIDISYSIQLPSRKNVTSITLNGDIENFFFLVVFRRNG